jgi:hypothetical protein
MTMFQLERPCYSSLDSGLYLLPFVTASPRWPRRKSLSLEASHTTAYPRNREVICGGYLAHLFVKFNIH